MSSLKWYALTVVITALVTYALVPTKKETVKVTEFVEVRRVEHVEKQNTSDQRLKAKKATIKPSGEIVAEDLDFALITTSREKAHLSEIARLQRELEHKVVEKKTSAGLLALADFDERNKHRGYFAGAYYGFGALGVKFDEQQKYRGYQVGIAVPLPSF